MAYQKRPDITNPVEHVLDRTCTGQSNTATGNGEHIKVSCAVRVFSVVKHAEWS